MLLAEMKIVAALVVVLAAVLAMTILGITKPNKQSRYIIRALISLMSVAVGFLVLQYHVS